MTEYRWHWLTSAITLLGVWACSGTDPMDLQQIGSPDQLGGNIGSQSGMQGDPVQNPTQPQAPIGPPDSIFERQHVVEVRIQMAPEDWDSLSYEAIGMREILFPADGYPDSPPYSHFSATVDVDGIQYDDVDVRKKGYIGSMTVVRPSLKLDFGRNYDLPLAHGLRRMTLNNDLQDPSHIRQCLSYDLFTQVGVPAPRCNYAHVVVNGEDLGFYSHIETMGKPMLARHFADNSGNLYEGELADFTSTLVGRIEAQTNEDENDRADIQAVVDALALGDGEVMTALERVVNLDNFFDFWALETLLGHWDGYSGNANNYFAYHDPTTDQFFFMPWGTDQTFVGDNPNDARPYEITVYAAGAIANRLYSLPAQRERYRARLAQLNDELWNVPVLLDRVEALSRLAFDGSREHVTRLRSYIRAHGEDLRAALALPAPEWPAQEPSSNQPDPCTGTAGNLSGSFSTRWGSIAVPASADAALAFYNLASPAQLNLMLDGSPFQGGFRGLAGEDGGQPGMASLRFGAPANAGWFVVIDLMMPVALFEPGYHPFQAFESFGAVSLYNPDQGYYTIALIGDGAVQLDAASLEPGHAVSGTVSGIVDYFACASTITGATQ